MSNKTGVTWSGAVVVEVVEVEGARVDSEQRAAHAVLQPGQCAYLLAQVATMRTPYIKINKYKQSTL